MLKMVHINRKDGTRAFASAARQGRDRLAKAPGSSCSRRARARLGPGEAALQERRRPSGRGNRRMGIPMAVNSGRLWPRNSFLKYPGMITISIGAPIPSANKTADMLNQEVETWIEAEMRRIDPDSYRRAGNQATA
jgi:1-acyl-sn-glycerol-3-phosphate acyltransferase